jgi:hypothetical protein
VSGNRHTLELFERLWQRRIDEALKESGRPVVATVSVTSESGHTRAVLTFEMSDETAAAIVSDEQAIEGATP